MARFCKPSQTEILFKSLRELSGLSEEGVSRTNMRERMEPGTWARMGKLYRDFSDGFFTIESVARRYPKTIGRIYRPLARAFEPYKRDQQRDHHTITSEFLDMTGEKPYGPKRTAGALLLQFVRTQHLIGDKALDGKALRAMIRAFHSNGVGDPTIPYDLLIPGNKFREVTRGDVQAYQKILKYVDDTLSDREIAHLRKFALSMQKTRDRVAAAMRAQLEKSVPLREEVDRRMKEYMGPDIPSYFPVMRDFLRQGDSHSSFPAVDPNDLAAMDRFFGAESMDKDLATELYAVADFMRSNPRNASGFKFKDPESLGLPATEYRRVDEALMDLLSIPYSENNKDLVDQMIRIVSDIGGGSKKPRSVIAAISAIPESVRVKFYQRRLVSKFPQRHPDLIEGFGAYMNASLKALHFNPVLAEAVPIIEQLKKEGDVHQADFLARYIYDVIGNPNRVDRELVDSMNNLTSMFYLGTLLGNVSSTVANYVGQTGFVFAEAGLRPTLVAFRSLMENRIPGHKQNYLVELMEKAGIGLESIPRGETSGSVGLTGLWDRLGAIATAHTWGEAVRRTRRFSVDMVDIFAASEMRVRKVGYLSGMIRHLEAAGVWKTGMGQEALDAAARTYTADKSNLLRMMNAGEDVVANGAFLFGNINQPFAVRAMKQLPGGLGGPVLMFANYPIQAMARLGIWTSDMARVHQNPALARESAAKLFRFFTYGTAVAGPFFMLPVLRGVASEGDEDLAGDLKRAFVSWEKNYSLAGLVGHGIQQLTGEYETVALAEKISPFPTAIAPAGPLGEIGGGPVVQFAKNATVAFGPGFGDLQYSPERIKAREILFGGFLENMASGLGSETRPAPTGGVSTMVPGGVAMARLFNSFVGTGVLTDSEPVELDRFGRLARPTSMSTEIIRQFGRPLGEILDAAEGRISEQEAEARTFTVQRLRKAVLEGHVSMVGQILLQDPSLVGSIEPNDLERALQSKELVPQARAMSSAEIGLTRKVFRRAILRRQSGNLSPAEEFTVNQLIAVGALRIRREKEREERSKRAASRRGPASGLDLDLDVPEPGAE